MTGVCINLRKNMFSNDIDSLECSQEFDSYTQIGNKDMYLTLRVLTKGHYEPYRYVMKDLYRFVEGQLRICETKENVYFSNIMMGDDTQFYLPMFYYLLSLQKYRSISHRIYIGDVKGHGEFLKRIWNNQI